MTALRAENGRARAVRVSQASLTYLRPTECRPSKERRAELARQLRTDRGAMLDSVKALAGRTLTRVRMVDGEEKHTTKRIDRQCARTMRDILDALLGLLRKHEASTGNVECVVAITRPMLASWAQVSPETITEWMPWLQAAGVVLYHHGRSRHCSLVAFPERFEKHQPHARAVVEGHLRRAEHAVGKERELYAWWAPTCRMLLTGAAACAVENEDGEIEEVAPSIVFDALIAEEHQEHVERAAVKTAAVHARICETKAAALSLARATHEQEQREREAREDARRDQLADLLRDEQRAAAVRARAEAAKQRAADLDAELDAGVRRGELERILTVAEALASQGRARAARRPIAVPSETHVVTKATETTPVPVVVQSREPALSPRVRAGPATGEAAPAARAKTTLSATASRGPTASADEIRDRWRQRAAGVLVDASAGRAGQGESRTRNDRGGHEDGH